MTWDDKEKKWQCPK